jgi:D-alanyl-D-alanine carboxypeptidase
MTVTRVPFRAALLWPAAFAAVAALAVAGPKATKPPDTVEGRRVAAFLAAVDAGTEAPMREFVEKNFSARALERMPVEPRLHRLSAFAHESGPLELEKILAPAPEGPGIVARSKKTGRWYEIHLELEPGPARGIVGVEIEDSDASALEPEPRLRSDAGLARAADGYLAKLAREDRFSGVVLLARRGPPLFDKAYGLADREGRVPNTTETRFNIGSIDKIFTQVAIARLASEGKLALSDAIRRHLPDYPSPAADEITILQLVNMTSGLGDIFNERYAEAAPRLSTLADFLRLFADKPLLFPPGKGRQYSNAGYIVLGLIVEKVSGQGYHDYVREHVFAPAGMSATGPSERGAAGNGRATGYTRESEGAAPAAGLHPNTASLPARSSSAGGSLSTARDLLNFDRALSSGKLLPPEWTAWIYSDKTGPPSGSPPAPGGGGLGIAGGSPGVNAALESDNTRGYTVVVLANLDPPVAERTAAKLRRWMERVGAAKKKGAGT